MANVSDKVAQIRQAVYGKDVRESIASGIEAINDEVESTTARQASLETTFEQLIINAGNSNAEIVDARGGFDTLRKKLDSYAINVKDFGAKGDGVTDDTAAIQNALLEAGRKGAILFFPPGNYVYSQPIILQTNYKIIGSGKNDTVLKYQGELYAIQTINSDVRNCILANIGIDISSSQPGTSAIYLKNVFHSLFEELYINITNQNDGIIIDGSDNGAYFNSFNQIFIFAYGARYGINFIGSSANYPTSSIFHRVNVAGGITGRCVGGFNIAYGRQISFITCRAEHCQTGYYVNTGSIQFLNCIAESVDNGFFFDINSYAITAFGINVFDYSQQAINRILGRPYNSIIVAPGSYSFMNTPICNELKLKTDSDTNTLQIIFENTQYKKLAIYNRYDFAKTFLIRNETDNLDMMWISAHGTFSAPRIQVPSGATRPSAPSVGLVFFDTTINKLIIYNGTKWVDAFGNTV